MKILMVCPYFYPKIGGLESYVFHCCQQLRKDPSIEIIVITSNHDQKKDKIEIIDGIKIYRLSPLFRLSNTPINPFWLLRMLNILSIEKPDIINTHTPVPFISDIAVIASKIKRIPVVITYHAGGFKKDKLISDIITSVYSNSLEKIILYYADHLVVLNQYLKNVTLKDFNHKISHIPPGITLAGKIKTEKTFLPSDLIFVGNLNKTHSWKGLEFLIKAMEEIKKERKEITLNVVGGGDQLDYYKNLVKISGLENNIRFYGRRSSVEVEQFYSKSKILVLPSYSEAESLGLVMIEAMKHGLGIVASDIGGIPFIIKEGYNGLLVKPKNPLSIARAVEKLLSDKSLYKQISQNNSKTSNYFDWKIHVKKLKQVFENSIANSTV